MFILYSGLELPRCVSQGQANSDTAVEEMAPETSQLQTLPTRRNANSLQQLRAQCHGGLSVLCSMTYLCHSSSALQQLNLALAESQVTFSSAINFEAGLKSLSTVGEGLRSLTVLQIRYRTTTIVTTNI